PEANEPASLISKRSDGYTGPEFRSVVAQAPTFFFESPFFFRNFEFAARLARPQIFLGIKTRKVPANNFRCLVALESLGTSIPGADVPFGIQHEDGVVLNGLRQQTKSCFTAPQSVFCTLAFGEITSDFSKTDQFARLITNWADYHVRPEFGAI